MRLLKANLLINSAGAAPSAITLVSLKLRSRMFFSSLQCAAGYTSLCWRIIEPVSTFWVSSLPGSRTGAFTTVDLALDILISLNKDVTIIYQMRCAKMCGVVERSPRRCDPTCA